jgi:hypothetical protein
VIIIIIVLSIATGYFFVFKPSGTKLTSNSTTLTSTSTTTTSTNARVSFAPVNPIVITNAENFLVGEYNKSIGLLPEFIGAQNYWLYSDNYLAIQAFRNGSSSNSTQEQLIEQNVSKTLHNYMSKVPGAVNQYMVLTQAGFDFNASKDYFGMFTSEGKNISITLNNQTGALNPANYGDIAFLEAIYYHEIGNNGQATSLFNRGASMYDGIGIKDSVFKGQYQTFKLALYLYAGKLLNQNVPSSAQVNLLKMQGSNGGFYTGYDSNLSTSGTLENTETTSLSILALASL